MMFIGRTWFPEIDFYSEKPSIARAISEALSGNKFKNHRMGKGKCLLTFDGFFQGAVERIKTSYFSDNL